MSKDLKAIRHDQISFRECLGYLGCWFIVKVCLGCHHIHLCYLKPRDKFWNPSCLGDAMSDKRFEIINECLKLDNEE